MRIRTLIERDIPIVTTIAKMTMPYPWKAMVFHDCMKPNYHSWVLEIDRKIIGFIITLFQGDICDLMNIAIHPDYQHKGYAKYLMQHAIEFAKSHHKKCLQLEVRRSNQAAINFYKTLGSKKIAVRKNYYPSEQGREDALVFILNLTT